jgi:uncharacterized protein YdaU (DUF1376 family)
MLPFFVRDYITATRHMTLAERGAYTDLLFFQWENGRIPKETDRIARLIGSSIEEFSGLWPQIRDKFADSDGGLTNMRLEDHRAKSIELSTKRAIAGQAGGKQSGKQRASKPEAIASNLLGGLLVAKSNSPSPSPSPSQLPEDRLRPVPQSFHDEVIGAYHAICSTLPRVKGWPSHRKSALDARIRERCADGKPADSIEYWQSFFESVAASDFLCGRAKDFVCNIDWLLGPKNFLKVIEGNFGNRKPNGSAGNG